MEGSKSVDDLPQCPKDRWCDNETPSNYTAEYKELFSRKRLDFSFNDLGVECVEFDRNTFRRVAFVAGDDQSLPGQLVLKQYQINLGWPIIQSVLNRQGRQFALLWPRQSGKSTLIVQIVTQLAALIPSLFAKTYPHLSSGIKIGLYGPNREKTATLRDRVRSSLSSDFYRSVIGVTFDVHRADKLSLSNRSSMLIGTASESATCIEQPTFDLIIVEEAQAVSGNVIKTSLMPMLARTRGTIVLIGTASHYPKNHDYFYEIFNADDIYYEQTGKHRPGVYKLDIREVIKAPGMQDYWRSVQQRIKTEGYHSEAIQSQFFNVWEFEIGLSFIQPDQLYPLRQCKTIAMDMGTTYERVVVGIDVAQILDDTVVTVYSPSHEVKNDDPNVVDSNGNMSPTRLKKGRIIGWMQLGGSNFKEQAKEIKRFMTHYPGCTGGLIDVTGQGRGLYDFLVNDMDDKLKPLTWLDTDDTDEKVKMDRWVQFKAAILGRTFEYPKDDRPERHEFERQMKRLVKVKRGNTVKIDHPRTKGAKKDYPDSLILAMVAGDDLYQSLWFGNQEEETVDTYAVTGD